MGIPFSIAHFMAGMNIKNNDLNLTDFPKCYSSDTFWEDYKELL